MKFIFIGFLFMSLQGCGGCQRAITNWTGNLTEKCHKGVIYVQSDSGLALLVNTEGKPVECKE